MVDRSSTIDFINQKYRTAARSSIVQQTTVHAEPVIYSPTQAVSSQIVRRSLVRYTRPTQIAPAQAYPSLITQQRTVAAGPPIGVIPGTIDTTKATKVYTQAPPQLPHKLQNVDICNCCEACKVFGCPWWLFFLISMLLVIGLIALVGALMAVFGRPGAIPIGYHNPPISPDIPNSSNNGCAQGYFEHNGKCISCPAGSEWNGENCVKTQEVVVEPNVSTERTCGQGQVWNGSQCVACPPGMQWNGSACVRVRHHEISQRRVV